MSSLKECLASAVEQGAINSRQADELHSYYQERFQRNRATMNDGQAAAAAKATVSQELREKAARAARNALLSEGVRKQLLPRITAHKNLRGKIDPLDGALSSLVNYGTKGFGSMDGLKHAVIAMAHRDLAEVMHHFRVTKVTGRHRNKADTVDLVKALWGDNANNPEVKALATGLENVREDLRLRFNRAGGDMPRREGFDMNHLHNNRAMLKLDKDRLKARNKWKQFIRPLLDADAMTNPNTGEIVGIAGLDDALDYSWDKLISDGWAHHQPQNRKFGSGTIANKHQDSRFLQFKDADSWLAYNDRFGDKDVIANMFNQINSMASDIAALETFGPNPEAMLEWVKQIVRVEIGKNQAGTGRSPYAAAKGMSAGEAADYRISALWSQLRGRDTVWSKPAKWTADVRNVATAAMLGSTGILAAATDPVIAATSRYLAGLPVIKMQNSMLAQMARDFKTGRGQMEAAKRVILWEDYLHVMHENARYVDQMFGHEWSKYLVDRALTINALKPMTAARKRLEAGAWHSELGRLAADSVDWMDLKPLMRGAMEGFGLSAEDWHKMRAGVDAHGFLDPGGVLDKTGDRALAERYAEMIIQWNERSVPAGDPRVKSVITGGAARGTVGSELVEFGSQFLSFGMSFTARQMEAIYISSMLGKSTAGKIGRGATYFAAMSIPLMVGAAIYEQVKAIADGKDPEPMDNAEFWTKAFIKGGGGGLFADFVSRTENRFGQSFSSALPGPGVSMIGDTLDLTVMNIMRVMRGDEHNYGRQVSNYVGRYTPVLSSHPATRLAYRRLVVDNLQWLSDPKANKSFKAKARKKSYWWRPGEAGARRGPNF